MSEFNLDGEALRKLLVCAVNVSEVEGADEWEVQGYKTEDSSLEFNPDISTMTDILGEAYSDVNKFEVTQPFDPNTLRMGGKLNELLVKYWREGQLQKFSQFKVLIMYGFIGEEGRYEADCFSSCTITPTSLGGSSRVNMPFSINYGGERVKGTVNDLRKNIQFTAA